MVTGQNDITYIYSPSNKMYHILTVITVCKNEYYLMKLKGWSYSALHVLHEF